MLTDKDLEALGLKPTAKMVFVLIGERLFGHDGATWFEYGSQGARGRIRESSAPSENGS